MFGFFFRKTTDKENIPLIDKENKEEENNERSKGVAFSEKLYQGISYVWENGHSIAKLAMASLPFGISTAVEAYYASANNFHMGYEAGGEEALNDIFTTGKYDNPYPYRKVLPIEFLGGILGTAEAMINFSFGYSMVKRFAKGELSQGTWFLTGSVFFIGLQVSVIAISDWFNANHAAGMHYGYEDTWNNFCYLTNSSYCPTQNVTLNTNDYEPPAVTDNIGMKLGLSALASTVGLFAGVTKSLIEEIKRKEYVEIPDPVVSLKN